MKYESETNDIAQTESESYKAMELTAEDNTANSIISANIHIIGSCNYRCGFCIAKELSKSYEPVESWTPHLKILKDNGVLKINIAGGEPFLYPHLKDFCVKCKEMGFIVSIVTNGSLVSEETLRPLLGSLDWIGFSVDSPDDEVERAVGRHSCDRSHIEDMIRAAELAHSFGLLVKLNVTVIRQSKDADFTKLVRKVNPNRLKFFQALKIENMNGDSFDRYYVSDGEFRLFEERHGMITLSDGSRPVFEDNATMVDSYLALDPQGRVMYDAGGRREYLELSPESIRRVNRKNYEKRGGREFMKYVGSSDKTSEM